MLIDVIDHPTADGPRHRLVMDDANGWIYLNTAPGAGRVPTWVLR